ncbi:SDR family NAD(P)-dependent oxidoreductase [Psychrobacter sp. ASPA161_9]
MDMDTQASNTFANDLFANKVAVVTGATSGIGRAMAIAFAQKGVKYEH